MFYMDLFVRSSPQGLLRIGLLAGQNLVPKDNLMGGMVKGKSDPYVKVNVGGETFTSHVVKANLNPTWNEMYEVRPRLDAPPAATSEPITGALADL